MFTPARWLQTSVELDQNATNQLLAHEKLSHGDDEILGVEIDRPEMGKYFIPKNPVQHRLLLVPLMLSSVH